MKGDSSLFLALSKIRPAPVAVFFKRMLGVERAVIDTDQGKFWLDPVSTLGRALMTTGIYEPQMQQTLNRFLKPGKVFIDLGANEGYFTVHGGRLVGPSGRVIAVEPQSRLLSVLQKNLWLNDLTNVEIVNAAIADRKGIANLHLAPETNTGSSGIYRSTKYVLPTQRTETLVLGGLLEQCQIHSVDLLKIDIEGYEYEAIFGSPEVFINRQVKAVALEFHPSILLKRGKNAFEIESFLSNAGYERVNEFRNHVWAFGS